MKGRVGLDVREHGGPRPGVDVRDVVAVRRADVAPDAARGARVVLIVGQHLLLHLIDGQRLGGRDVAHRETGEVRVIDDRGLGQALDAHLVRLLRIRRPEDHAAARAHRGDLEVDAGRAAVGRLHRHLDVLLDDVLRQVLPDRLRQRPAIALGIRHQVRRLHVGVEGDLQVAAVARNVHPRRQPVVRKQGAFLGLGDAGSRRRSAVPNMPATSVGTFTWKMGFGLLAVGSKSVHWPLQPLGVMTAPPLPVEPPRPEGAALGGAAAGAVGGDRLHPGATDARQQANQRRNLQ